jgi:hypothetical protein
MHQLALENQRRETDARKNATKGLFVQFPSDGRKQLGAKGRNLRQL